MFSYLTYTNVNDENAKYFKQLTFKIVLKLYYTRKYDCSL